MMALKMSDEIAEPDNSSVAFSNLPRSRTICRSSPNFDAETDATAEAGSNPLIASRIWLLPFFGQFSQQNDRFRCAGKTGKE